jgi:hypothetical protein
LSREGLQTLVADQKATEFTVVQIVAGLVADEQGPIVSGHHNEGGAVWDPEFKQINPQLGDRSL